MTRSDHILPLIHAARCNGCGECVALCPTHAVEVLAGLAVIVRPAACTFCEICETYCPEGAIERPFAIVFAPDQSGATVERRDPAKGAHR